MATVIHKYQPSQISVERAAEKKAEAERKAAEKRRAEEVKRSASRSANRGAAGLRRERTKFERVRRLEKEMEIAVRRGELIERAVVLQQASFLLTALRSRCMSAPSAWARRLLNVSDPRAMTDLLRQMMVSVLEEISDLPVKVTRGDSIDGENGAPLAEVNGGPTAEG